MAPQTLMTPVQEVGWGDAEEVPGFPPPLLGPPPQRQSPSSRVGWEVVNTFQVQIRLNWSDGIIFVKKSIVFHQQDLSDKVKKVFISFWDLCNVCISGLLLPRAHEKQVPLLIGVIFLSICVSPSCMRSKRQNYLPKQSSFWMVCNLKCLNSLTVKHQCSSVSLSEPGLLPPGFIYGQFGDLGPVHLFLAVATSVFC